MPSFLSIGECMIELASLGDNLMRKGFAGDSFNTAWYARSLLPTDWHVEYLTAVGDDASSDEMVTFIEAAGIDTRYIARLPGCTPGLYMIHLTNGERSFSYWRSASAARCLADDPDRLSTAIAAADIVYFSGITLAILAPQARERLIGLARGARDDGKMVAFDPNLRLRLWTSDDEMKNAVEAAASAASLVLPGFDDEAVHFGDASLDDTIDRYHRLGVETVVVKDGSRGAMLSRDGFRVHVAAHKPAAVIDTTARR